MLVHREAEFHDQYARGLEAWPDTDADALDRRRGATSLQP